MNYPDLHIDVLELFAEAQSLYADAVEHRAFPERYGSHYDKRLTTAEWKRLNPERVRQQHRKDWAKRADKVNAARRAKRAAMKMKEAA